MAVAPPAFVAASGGRSTRKRCCSGGELPEFRSGGESDQSRNLFSFDNCAVAGGGSPYLKPWPRIDSGSRADFALGLRRCISASSNAAHASKNDKRQSKQRSIRK